MLVEYIFFGTDEKIVQFLHIISAMDGFEGFQFEFIDGCDAMLEYV